MLGHNDLKQGVQFILEGDPYQVLDSSFTFKGRGSSTMQAKIKNLKNGNILTRTFHQGDDFKEAELEKKNIAFIYSDRRKYVFAEQDNPSNRFEFQQEQIGDQARFLIPNTVVEGLVFQGKIINISLPIKMQFRVKEAPPGIKGDRAQGGTKTITLETGAVIQAPLFVGTGDMVEINTETGEYARRIEKAE
ncbi:elongation factor P [Patescibacteria group bacterium]|nr:elongation factor P [Patescibacteria group bacterium]